MRAWQGLQTSKVKQWCSEGSSRPLTASLPVAALISSVAAQEASLPLFAGESVDLNPHLQALERLMGLLDPELCAAMVAAHERDGMGPSAFGFAYEWLMLLGKRQLTNDQARHACVLSHYLIQASGVCSLFIFCGSLRQPMCASCS